jgi:hypothetical protein
MKVTKMSFLENKYIKITIACLIPFLGIVILPWFFIKTDEMKDRDDLLIKGSINPPDWVINIFNE